MTEYFNFDSVKSPTLRIEKRIYPLPFVDNMEDNYNHNRVTEARHYYNSKTNSFV